RLLKRGGEVVHLTPKAFDTLLVMVENRGNVLEKRDLMDRLWPNTFVEESNLSFQVYTIRKALGERPNEHRYIVTIPGQGYCFSGQVTKVPAEVDLEDMHEPSRSSRVLERLEGDPENGFVSGEERQQTPERLESSTGLIAPVSYLPVQPDADDSAAD